MTNLLDEFYSAIMDDVQITARMCKIALNIRHRREVDAERARRRKEGLPDLPLASGLPSKRTRSLSELDQAQP